MKKFLAISLGLSVTIPSVSNALVNSDIICKKENTINLDNMTCINDDNSVNWDEIYTKIDKDVLNNMKRTGNLEPLTSQEIQDFHSKAKGDTDFFKKNNYTLQQAQDYIKNNNAQKDQFKKYYNDPGKAVDDNKNATLLQQVARYLFDPITKSDLNFSTQNTYQDVLNNLIAKLKSKFGTQFNNNQIVLTLTNPSQANEKLYNSVSSLLDIVNNTFAIQFNLQVDKSENTPQTLFLENISARGKDLYEAVSTYFSSNNAQELSPTLGIESSGNEYLDLLISKIKQRFPNFTDAIDISTTDSEASSRGYIINDENLMNEVCNENLAIPVSISDNADNLTKNTYVHIKNITMPSDPFAMIPKMVLHGMLGNDCDWGKQDLKLKSDDLCQVALDKFSARLKRFFNGSDFNIKLADESLATKPLWTVVNISDPTNFSLKVTYNLPGFSAIEGVLNLNNVQTSVKDQKALDALKNLQEQIKTLKKWNLALSACATTCAIAAAGFWALAYFSGVTTTWAVACTVVTGIFTTAVGAVGLNEYIKDAGIASYWQRVELSVTSVRSLGHSIYNILGPILMMSSEAATLFDWVIPAVLAGISFISLMISILMPFGN